MFEMSLRRCMRRLKYAFEMYLCLLGLQAKLCFFHGKSIKKEKEASNKPAGFIVAVEKYDWAIHESSFE